MFEVNLVPDVKAELLKAQKVRKFVIYIAIMVAAICVAVLGIMGAVIGGQSIALSNQDKEMTEKSNKILSFQNLDLNLTIQDQLGKLAEVGSNRRVLSRVFGILDVILPTGEDEVNISELSINLPNSTLSFDGQANSSSNIDYRALEVFKKTVELSYYDYGRYIDDEGEEIPSFCVDEIVENGVLYGIYHKGATGCGLGLLVMDEGEDEEDGDGEEGSEETEEGGTVVEDIRIKRDMTTKELDEAISKGQPYFQSACIEEGENVCLLVDEAVNIRESSNGRNSAGDLVLRFSTIVTINPEVFSFANKHMRVIGPTRQNVTDSYIQVRNMFTEEAEDCAADDYECLNAGGGN